MFTQITRTAHKTAIRFVVLSLLLAFATLLAPPPALAAPTFTVNNAADAVAAAPLNNGLCQTASNNNDCTLRAAIMKANHYPGGGATIMIPSTYSHYELSIQPSGSDDETTGDLNITASMTIIGAGESKTIIDSSPVNDRVFNIASGIIVTLSGVTIKGGFAGAGNVGGAIFNAGMLGVSNSTIFGSTTNYGGGIFNYHGTLTLTSSTVLGGHAANNGGGIFNDDLGTLKVINSTINENFAFNGGGGIQNNGTLNVINSTISGNNSNQDGGGITNFGTSNLFNTTITNNQADSDFNGSGTGGGIFNNSGATVNFRNSIIARNSETAHFGCCWLPVDGECAGAITSQGLSILYNYDTSHCTVINPVTLADPKLGSLQNNGGPTQTHALLINSPARDAGNPSGCMDNLGATLTTDQRGFRRVVGVRCDIGAYEFGYYLFVPLILK